MMDGQQEYFDVEKVEEVKNTRQRPQRQRRKSFSKIFHCIILCLIQGKYKHMLKLLKGKERFLVTLKNKKNKEWNTDWISFFQELDSVFENRIRPREHYEEKTKGRFRANISKLIKSGKIKHIKTWKEPKSVTKHIYEILCPESSALLRDNASAGVNFMDESASTTLNPLMENTSSNILIGNTTAHAQSDISQNLCNLAENISIPVNNSVSEEEISTGECSFGGNVITPMFFQGINLNMKGECDVGKPVLIPEFFEQDNFGVQNMDVLENCQKTCPEDQLFKSTINEVKKNAAVGYEVVENDSNSLNAKNNLIDTERGSASIGNISHFIENGSIYGYPYEETGSATIGSVLNFPENGIYLDGFMYPVEGTSEQGQSFISENDTKDSVTNVCYNVENVCYNDSYMCLYEDTSEQRQSFINETENSCVVKDIAVANSNESIASDLQFSDFGQQNENYAGLLGNFGMTTSSFLDENLSVSFPTPLEGMIGDNESWLETCVEIRPSEE